MDLWVLARDKQNSIIQQLHFSLEPNEKGTISCGPFGCQQHGLRVLLPSGAPQKPMLPCFPVINKTLYIPAPCVLVSNRGSAFCSCSFIIYFVSYCFVIL